MPFGGFRNEDLFEENMALRCEVKNLRRTVDEFKSGKRYLKLQEDHKRVTRGYIKEIKRLKDEIAAAHAQAIHVRDIWTDECYDLWQKHLEETGKKEETIRRLEEKNWELQRKAEEKIRTLALDYEGQLQEKDCIIAELTNKLAHAEALLGRDSTNTNLPTGQTPPGKEKHIPNSRRGSGKKKGGQPGHKRHLMGKPSPEEVTGEADHPLRGDEACPSCGSGQFTYTGRYEEKYEVDVEVKVLKALHKVWLYQCDNCGEIIKSSMGPSYHAECQYGPMVQATALSLMNTTNAAINKVPMFLAGLTNGDIHPSEGYIAKLMKRASKQLEPFMEGLHRMLVTRPLVYWDDTVVMADKKRICLRFYGDEKTAYYVAHDKKDMEGVLEDGVLEALTPQTRVMHDHNSINYNERFKFANIECNAHLQRDLQRILDETGHKEVKELKEFLSGTIKDRNDAVGRGEPSFSDGYVEGFDKKLTDLLARAREAAEKNTSKYSGPFERAVVRRLDTYRDNYFAWVRDFTVPTTNNLSERALRGVKTKMKVSGQFASTQTANNYARIRSYIETCRRNGINEMGALCRLCSGNPYTVKDIFSTV